MRIVKNAGDVLADGRAEGAKSRRGLLVGALYPRLGMAAGIALTLPDGQYVPCSGHKVAGLRFNDWGALSAFLLRDQLRTFECYLAGRVDLVPEVGDAAASLLSALEAFDEASLDLRWLSAALSSSRYFWQQNTRARESALSVHYSVPAEFWLSFLTNDYPIYSHYLFQEDETHEAWERACERKLEYAVSACKLKPGERVLNIGEGWGGFLTYAGRRGMQVTSITLNDDSYAACKEKRQAEALVEKCELIKGDFYQYESSTPFDGITNMGVTEHLTDYDALLARYARLLKSGGSVYSDFVGVTRDAPFRSLVQKHVYPGAAAVYLPRLLSAVERNGNFDVVAVHDDRLSYDKTCEAWARNVEARQAYIVECFGEARYRWIWSYLWMSVYGFRTYRNGITGTRVVLRKR